MGDKHKGDIEIGRRMMEELVRLYGKKAKIVRQFHCGHNTLYCWDYGATPGGFELAKLHYAGGDVIYVLTGKRGDEVVHGRWLYDSGTERHFCSACNEYALSVTYEEPLEDYDWEENLVFRTEAITKEFRTDFCPHCGAKMDGAGNG